MRANLGFTEHPARAIGRDDRLKRSRREVYEGHHRQHVGDGKSSYSRRPFERRTGDRRSIPARIPVIPRPSLAELRRLKFRRGSRSHGRRRRRVIAVVPSGRRRYDGGDWGARSGSQQARLGRSEYIVAKRMRAIGRSLCYGDHAVLTTSITSTWSSELRRCNGFVDPNSDVLRHVIACADDQTAACSRA